MVTKKNRKRKSTKKKFDSRHHKGLDDYMVTGVLVASGMAILILLATYLTATGQAVSGTPDTTGAITVFQGSELISGEGTMKCSYACARNGKTAIISSLDGELVGNHDVINGEYTCLCGSLD